MSGRDTYVKVGDVHALVADLARRTTADIPPWKSSGDPVTDRKRRVGRISDRLHILVAEERERQEQWHNHVGACADAGVPAGPRPWGSSIGYLLKFERWVEWCMAQVWAPKTTVLAGPLEPEPGEQCTQCGDDVIGFHACQAFVDDPPSGSTS